MSSKAVLTAAVVAVALLGAPVSPARGQSDWGRYMPGSLAAVMQEHDSIIPPEWNNGRLSVVVSGDDYPTLARVIYRGKSRPLQARRADVLREWSLTFLRDTSLLSEIHREYLFQEGKQLLWLPVQDTVASFFPKELTPGQPVSLYVIFLGAARGGKEIFWAFIVNEFNTKPITQSV